MCERKFFTINVLICLIGVLALLAGSFLLFWRETGSVRQGNVSGNVTELTGSGAWTGINNEFVRGDFAAIIALCPSKKVCAAQQPALAKASVAYNHQRIAFLYTYDPSALKATNYGLQNETTGDLVNSTFATWDDASSKTEREAWSSGQPVYVYLERDQNGGIDYEGMHIGGMSAEQLEQVAAEFADAN